MLETFTRNVEQQGLQLPQYLRLVGKEQDAFEQEIRTEAEARIRRSLALDAFATAERIGVEQQEVEQEVHLAAASSDEPAAVERLAMNNPNTLQRVEEATRERKAMARLIELATGDGRNGGEASVTASVAENTAEVAETSDTETMSREARESAAPLAQEDRGSA
jgi:FKBP-type peptidyl-prolyl cis-trans isomerase (trigger factor)